MVAVFSQPNGQQYDISLAVRLGVLTPACPMLLFIIVNGELHSMVGGTKLYSTEAVLQKLTYMNYTYQPHM